MYHKRLRCGTSCVIIKLRIFCGFMKQKKPQTKILLEGNRKEEKTMNPEYELYEIIPAAAAVLAFGLVIGSFLNVCILRIPEKESVVTRRSHCMNCGYQLSWYDMVPVFSYLALGGKCRKCKARISAQYPLVEGLNGILCVIAVVVNGINFTSVLYCFLTSALIVLSVIDFRTCEIPFGINVFIFVLGLVHLFSDPAGWQNYIAGFLAISVPLELIVLASRGRALGGGDVKLMAAAGLLLGWKNILLALVIGCILGSIIHVARMKITHTGHMLALGPYLAAGIYISALWGDGLVRLYLDMLRP